MDEQGKELMISAVRSALGAVPFAGQALNEVFFEYRGRIKHHILDIFPINWLKNCDSSQYEPD